jgi:hypothetical protein
VPGQAVTASGIGANSWWLERFDKEEIQQMARAIFGGHGDEAIVRAWRERLDRV